LPSLLQTCETIQAMPAKRMNVFGPYPAGSRWRLLFRENGRQQAVPFDTREQAEAAKERMLSSLDEVACKTICEAVEEFVAAKLESGCLPETAKASQERLLFLPMSAPLSSITRERAEQLYRGEIDKQLSVSTHHYRLRMARSFFTFCVERRYVTTNPFKEIRAIGRPKVGKLQLRRDEAKQLSNVLLEHAHKGDCYALALTVQLLFGLRSAEMLSLRKRDLDADGTMLVVEGTKTCNARRTLSIESPIVRELLARRVASLTPESFIFGRKGATKRLSNTILFKNLHRFCALAGVPLVCPHSLRGLHSSLAVEGGMTSAAVAAALGHGSDAITLKHYIAPGAVAAARTSRISAALLETDTEKLIASLRALSRAQLKHVLSAVGDCS
jgi:integrase